MCVKWNENGNENAIIGNFPSGNASAVCACFCKLMFEYTYVCMYPSIPYTIAFVAGVSCKKYIEFNF